jgi:biotin transport system substrate-specific component
MAENSLIRSIRPMVLSAVFAALIAVGAFIQFNLPFTPVPVTLQTLFVLLAGLFLPPGWALASIFLYLFAGLIGLPVFASGMRGFAAFQGPSAGFLLGFAVAGSHSEPYQSHRTGRGKSLG